GVGGAWDVCALAPAQPVLSAPGTGRRRAWNRGVVLDPAGQDPTLAAMAAARGARGGDPGCLAARVGCVAREAAESSVRPADGSCIPSRTGRVLTSDDRDRPDRLDPLGRTGQQRGLGRRWSPFG